MNNNMQNNLQSQFYQQQMNGSNQQQYQNLKYQNNPHLAQDQEYNDQEDSQNEEEQQQQVSGSDDDMDFEDTDECVIPNKQENTHNIPQSQNLPSQTLNINHDRVSTLSAPGQVVGYNTNATQSNNPQSQNHYQTNSTSNLNIPRSSAQMKSNQVLAADSSISPKFSQQQYNSSVSGGFGNMINQGFNSKSTAMLNMQNSVLIPSSTAHKQPGDYDGQFDPEQYSKTFQNITNSQSNNNNDKQNNLNIPNQLHQQQQQQQYNTTQQQSNQQLYNTNSNIAQQQQQQSQQNARSMKSSKSHKNFHSVVGTHSYNQLTQNTNNHNTQSNNNNRNSSNHFSGNLNQNQYISSNTQQDTMSNGTHQKNKDPEQDKDFNRAYQKLVKKMYQESGQNLLITQDEIERIAYQQQYLSLNDFNQRNQQCLENKQQKTKLLQEMKQQQEMQECTFKPQTYSQKQKRNFDQFLKDQAQFEEQKKKRNRDRIEQNMSQQQKELKTLPAVNKKSAKMVEIKKKQINDDLNDMQLTDKPIEDKPVYERLHKIHHEKMQRQVQKQQEHTNMVTGKSQNNNSKSQSRNMKKNKSEANFTTARDRELQNGKTVDEMLYEDAKRRWEKQEIKKKNQEKLKDEQIQSTRPPTGNNNSKFAAQKFEKEFYFLVHHIMMDQNTPDTQTDEQNQDINLREYDTKKLNYVKLGQLMTELGYIPQNIAPDSQERELLFDLWNMLQGEENSGVFIINIKKMLLAIQGICIDLIEKGGQNSQQMNSMDFRNHNSTKNANQNDDSNNNRYSSLIANNFDENGMLRLSQQECNKLFVRFKPLYVNRIQFLGQFKRIKNAQENSCTFKPQISQTSENLAIQRRMRILSETRQSEGGIDNQESTQSNNGNINTEGLDQKVDLVSLLLHPVNTDKQWQQNAKLMLEQKELEECTFKPKITNYQGDSTRSRIIMNGVNIDKCLELYSMAKPLREKKDKTKNDYEFEKGQEECTFQPNIQESKKGLDQLYLSTNQFVADSQFLGSDCGLNQTTTQNIKGYQMMMTRMQKGREDREKLKQMTTRGIPGTVTDEAMLRPLQIEGNTNYKGAFSTFSHQPNFNIHYSQQPSQTQNTTQMNKPRLQSSKSNESLNSIVATQQAKRQSQQIPKSNNVNTAPILKQSFKQEKENVYYQNPLSNSVSGSIFGQEKQQLQNPNSILNNRPNSSLAQQQQYSKQQQQQHYPPNQRISDLSYDNSSSNNNHNDYGKGNSNNLLINNNLLNIPSDTDPTENHSIVSKTTSIKQPLLYVDVNLGPGKSERIVVYEGDTADSLAEKFAVSHSLDLNMKGKLAQLLDSQIAGLLEKIEEEQNSIHSDVL